MPLSYWTFNIFQFKQHSPLHSSPFVRFFPFCCGFRCVFFLSFPFYSKSFVPLKKVFITISLHARTNFHWKKVFFFCYSINEIVDVIDLTIQRMDFYVISNHFSHQLMKCYWHITILVFLCLSFGCVIRDVIKGVKMYAIRLDSFVCLIRSLSIITNLHKFQLIATHNVTKTKWSDRFSYWPRARTFFTQLKICSDSKCWYNIWQTPLTLIKWMQMWYKTKKIHFFCVCLSFGKGKRVPFSIELSYGWWWKCQTFRLIS